MSCSHCQIDAMNIFRTLRKTFIPDDFRRQLVLVLVYGVISTAVISTFVISQFTSSAVSKNLLEEGLKITETFASQSVLGLLVSNVENVEDSVNTILNFPGVEGVGIYDVAKKPLVERGNEFETIASEWSVETKLIKETNTAWHFVSPVYYIQEEDPFGESVDPELLGYVRVVQSKESLFEETKVFS